MILGREREQADLRRFLALIRAGEGGAVVLHGEPGIGKTTLLDWASEGAAGMAVLRAVGHESDVDLPFVGLADLLRPLQGQFERLPRPQARALRSALAMSDPASSDRIAIGAATLNIIHEVSETQPVLLVIDDYQWLDSATQSVVSFLAPRSQHRSFGLLIATREEALTVHRGRDVTLDPLTTEAAAALLNQRGQLSSRAIARV
ncbi:MAG TPA: ATP-binding protein, partial [Acidimicrobiia bacterium]